ncbi:hypothetical protein C8J57DRAFT_1215125 [Mycena rebaudengoi]|nr:hypothetical protein C8J57DRAFT_1215125 [Mycena rebaudengoi]
MSDSAGDTEFVVGLRFLIERGARVLQCVARTGIESALDESTELHGQASRSEALDDGGDVFWFAAVVPNYLGLGRRSLTAPDVRCDTCVALVGTAAHLMVCRTSMACNSGTSKQSITEALSPTTIYHLPFHSTTCIDEKRVKTRRDGLHHFQSLHLHQEFIDSLSTRVIMDFRSSSEWINVGKLREFVERTYPRRTTRQIEEPAPVRFKIESDVPETHPLLAPPPAVKMRPLKEGDCEEKRTTNSDGFSSSPAPGSDFTTGDLDDAQSSSEDESNATAGLEKSDTVRIGKFRVTAEGNQYDIFDDGGKLRSVDALVKNKDNDSWKAVLERPILRLWLCSRQIPAVDPASSAKEVFFASVLMLGSLMLSAGIWIPLLAMPSSLHSAKHAERKAPPLSGELRSDARTEMLCEERTRGWRKNFKDKHRTWPTSDDVDESAFVKAFSGQRMRSENTKDTPPCNAMIHSRTCLKKPYCPHAHIENGQPQTSRIINRACFATLTIYVPIDPSIRKALIVHPGNTPHNHPMPPQTKAFYGLKNSYRKAINSAGVVGATVAKVDHGASQLVFDDLKKPIDERYIQRLVTMPDGGIMILTCLSTLIKLLDDSGVTSFETDTNFTRVAGDMNEWEVVIFLKALEPVFFTIAREYVNGPSTEFFEKLYDEFQTVKLETTGKAVALKRFVPGGNLVALNSDMRAAQVLGAARYFFKTNDPSLSNLSDDTPPEKVAPEFVRLAVLDFFKGLVNEDYYHRLMGFMYIDSAEKLEAFSEFVRGLGSTPFIANASADMGPSSPPAPLPAGTIPVPIISPPLDTTPVSSNHGVFTSPDAHPLGLGSFPGSASFHGFVKFGDQCDYSWLDQYSPLATGVPTGENLSYTFNPTLGGESMEVDYTNLFEPLYAEVTNPALTLPWEDSVPQPPWCPLHPLHPSPFFPSKSKKRKHDEVDQANVILGKHRDVLTLPPKKTYAELCWNQPASAVVCDDGKSAAQGVSHLSMISEFMPMSDSAGDMISDFFRSVLLFLNVLGACRFRSAGVLLMTIRYSFSKNTIVLLVLVVDGTGPIQNCPKKYGVDRWTLRAVCKLWNIIQVSDHPI